LHRNSGPDTDSQRQQSDPPVIYGAAEWAATSRVGLFAGSDFEPQPDGTLRCPTNHPLYPQERRAEQDGTLRIVYAARIRDCRTCPLCVQCLAHGNETKHASLRERCSQANRGTIASTRACSVSCSCHAADSVGRLEPVPDTAQADEPFVHTNRHHHASTSHRPSALWSRARPIDPAGTQTCSANVGAASGTQRLERIRVWCEASPVRHSNGLRPGHRPSFGRIGMVPVLGSHQARRKGAVSASRRAFFSGYARDFSHSILLICNISFLIFLILNYINKRNLILFLYKTLINSFFL